jgi:indolepyruvate ferredoxin oxidoreductase beta subunit
MKTNVKELNIIICGVGGQGVVLISDLLGNAAVDDRLHVKGSEVLGMAQRGGPVFSNIRLGEEVDAPLTMDGKCDILLSLEPSETLRHIAYLNSDSIVIMNTQRIVPVTVSIGQSSYPDIDQVLKKLKTVVTKIVVFDATSLAQQAGSRLATNVVMLGALFGTGKMPIREETIKAVIRSHFPAKTSEVNIKAFDIGLKEVNR